MQKDLVYRFGKYFEDDKIVLDNYSLDAGFYVRIDKSGNIIKILEIDKNSYEDLKGNEDYEWFKDRDFYSCIINLDMNKSIMTQKIAEIKNYSTSKKIMSNNYLTLFFKNDIIKELCDQEKEALPIEVFKQIIQRYYELLSNLGEYKKEDKIILDKIMFQEISNKDMEKCKNIYLDNIEKIFEELKKLNIKKGTRIKLFIEDTTESYQHSSLKYYALKIFNANTYNKLLNNELYGANNYNFSMNSKKPYYELKTTTYKVPSRITLKEIKTIRNMYIWLIKNMNLFREEYLSTKFNFIGKFNDEELMEFFILKCVNDNGSLLIDNFEYIPKYTNNIKEIVFRNYLNELKLKDFEQRITDIKSLESFVNLNWFSKCLQSGYYDYKSVSSLRIDSCYKNFITQYSRIFYEFFYKLNDKPLKQNIDKIGINITKEILLNELTSNEFTKFKTLYNSTKSLNIYLVLKEYLCGKGGENMDNIIDNLKESMRNVLNTEAHINTEDEFCFLVGQVSYYLISHSKAEKLTQDVFEPIINAGNSKALKNNLNYLYKKYKHEIGVNNKRFNKAFTEMLAYEPKEKLKNNERLLLIGFLTDNLFYEKKGEIVNE